MPHLLVAGSTGSGKSVCLNTIIVSLLFQNSPETLRFIMVDPKKVELTAYADIPHLLTPVITDVKKTVNALKWAVAEMERRYTLLQTVGKRNIDSYNSSSTEKLPYIVFVIDEMADLMVSARNEVETLIIRLAQMARAVGIHLVLATQRPSVDVITGLIKANIPSRIAFAVASSMDSRTILDASGAEKLVGKGDMLFSNPQHKSPVRIQGAFLSEEEVSQVTDYLKERSDDPVYDNSITEKASASGSADFSDPDEGDELFEEARTTVIQAGRASTSFLQRKFKIGYSRAARLMDLLEQAGVVGPGEGAKPREILVSKDDLDTMGYDVQEQEPEDRRQESVVDDGSDVSEDAVDVADTEESSQESVEEALNEEEELNEVVEEVEDENEQSNKKANKQSETDDDGWL
ncbi:DNA translocase FtsK [Candidatus Falkowbacteria bacterium]|nr:DNA translocase FtsK [Candidatus Falkowbacteria bacterium]